MYALHVIFKLPQDHTVKMVRFENELIQTATILIGSYSSVEMNSMAATGEQVEMFFASPVTKRSGFGDMDKSVSRTTLTFRLPKRVADTVPYELVYELRLVTNKYLGGICEPLFHLATATENEVALHDSMDARREQLVPTLENHSDPNMRKLGENLKKGILIDG